MTVTLRLDTEMLDKIAGNLNLNRDRIIEAIAFEIEREAKQLVPVDTGTLRSSIHTVTKSGLSTQIRTNVPGTTIEDLPAPRGKVVAVVGSGVEYAAFVELGTHRMASRPYLGPAVEHQVNRLNSGQLWEDLCR